MFANNINWYLDQVNKKKAKSEANFIMNLRWNCIELVQNCKCCEIEIHIIDKLILEASEEGIEESFS